MFALCGLCSNNFDLLHPLVMYYHELHSGIRQNPFQALKIHSNRRKRIQVENIRNNDMMPSKILVRPLKRMPK